MFSYVESTLKEQIRYQTQISYKIIIRKKRRVTYSDRNSEDILLRFI